jgi:hypothetical protein
LGEKKDTGKKNIKSTSSSGTSVPVSKIGIIEIYVCVFIHTYMDTYQCIPRCISVYKYICICISIYLYVLSDKLNRICIHVCIFIYAYI